MDEKTLEKALAVSAAIRREIGRLIIGQEPVVEEMLTAFVAGGHVLFEGVPGLAKTLVVRCLAASLELSYSRIQFTPDLMPADIVGTDIITEDDGKRQFTYSPGPIFSNVVLADEINRATPKTQSALLEAMEERTVTVGKTTYSLEEPFIVLATQNPIEMEGTYPLPEAQVDRFLLKASVGFPSLDELVDIAERNTEKDGLRLPDPVATGEEILAARSVVREFPIAEELRRYVGRLVLATHPRNADAAPKVTQFVEYGASPRAAIALILGAKAHAFLAGEANVRLADIEAVFRPALVHRVILNFKGEAEGIEVSDLLAEVWKQTAVI